MNHEVERQRRLIDRSGLGLLPGIGLAFGLMVLVMTALQFQAWWITFAVVGAIFLTTAFIVWVVVKLIGEGEPTDGDR